VFDKALANRDNNDVGPTSILGLPSIPFDVLAETEEFGPSVVKRRCLYEEMD